MNVLIRAFCSSAKSTLLLIGHKNLPAVGCLSSFFASIMHSMDEDTFLFTSESVGEGHPDKICDQISDAVLDAHLAQDPDAKVACETVAKGGMILLCGEISSSAVVDVQSVVRRTLAEIGYNDPSVGLDAKTCTVLTALQAQSPEIAQGVHKNRDIANVAAGDQGLMFGYATDETPSFMPTTLLIAHNINRYLAHVRKTQQLPWVCPDTKSQVTCEYTNKNGSMVVKRVHTVVISTQHTSDVSVDFVRKEVNEKVIPAVIPSQLLDSRTVVHVNPCGAWSMGGPAVDAGLTGRKLMVDTYGGWGAHGGGAFSGKDPTKVDRSAAYAARWVAKSLVAAGLCRRCLIQVSYAIAIPDPISISVFHFGTARPGLSQKDLEAIVRHNFDLRPGAIIRDLDLLRPIYFMTAKYGHFGDLAFPWEVPKQLELPPTLQAIGYQEKGLEKFPDPASQPSSTATLSSNE